MLPRKSNMFSQPQNRVLELIITYEDKADFI